MLESHVTARSAAQAMRGTKQTCKNETCGSPYYDLRRAPMTCPYCGTIGDATAIIKIDFDTLGPLPPHRFKRRVEVSRPIPEVAKIEADDAEVADDQSEKEPASTDEGLLIEDDDEVEVETPVESSHEMS